MTRFLDKKIRPRHLPMMGAFVTILTFGDGYIVGLRHRTLILFAVVVGVVFTAEAAAFQWLLRNPHFRRPRNLQAHGPRSTTTETGRMDEHG